MTITMMTLRSKLKILALVIPVVFALDQFTKALVVRFIPLGGAIPILPNFFDLVHTRNRGAAFGFLADLPDSVRQPLFYVISLLALGAITIYFFKIQEDRRRVFAAVALILGGAAGNIWDRITRGEVVDFLSFHWYDRIVDWRLFGYSLHFRLEWPAFNVADSAITVAVTWLMITMSRPRRTS